MPERGAPAPRAGDYRVLDAFHLGTAAVVLTLVALDADARGGDRLVGATATLAVAVAYGALGRRLVRRGAAGGQGVAGRPAWVYLAVVLALLAVAFRAAPVTAWLLFSVCLQAFTLLPLWSGVAVVALAQLLLPAVDLLGRRHDVAAAQGGAWRALAVTAASAVVAAWVDSVTHRSAERADLVRQLQDSQARVAELSRAAGTDAERTRLSGEIHDTLAQGFLSILTLTRAAAATLRTDPEAAARHLSMAQEAARDNLAEARSMVAALAPPVLAQEGLAGALRRRAAQLAQATGVRATVEVGELPPLGREAEVVLLRAAQELLTNVEKHARARTATLTLAAGPAGTAVLTVTDDGVGPDPPGAGGAGVDGTGAGGAGVDGAGGGFGLRAMRERAAVHGGSVTVAPAPGGGTVAVVTVPAAHGRMPS